MNADRQSIAFEICGLPGAGKSTIAKELKQRSPDFRINPNLTTWQKTAQRAWIGLCLLPFQPGLGLFQTNSFTYSFSSAVSWRMHASVQIRLLERMVLQHQNAFQGIVLFDQGPIFYQTMLLGSYCNFEPNHRLRAWVYNSIEDWSAHLNALIWLDASNNTLLDRIVQRDKPHFLQGAKASVANEFLDGLRSTYAEILSRYSNNGVTTLRISTESPATASTLTEVSEILNGSELRLKRSSDCPLIGPSSAPNEEVRD